MEGVLDLLPLGDLRAELTLMARWSMQELRREQDFLRILQRDGPEFPDLLEAMRDRVVRPAYRQGAALFARHFGTDTVVGLDAVATASIALGAIVNYRQAEMDYGEPPGGVDEERFIETWVNLLVLVANAARPAEPPTTAPTRRPPRTRKPH